MWRLGLLLIGFCTSAWAAEVPVIVYHDIVRSGGDAYAVRESDFRNQMDFLKRQGWHPIRLTDYARAATHGAPLPDKPVILSFDDGLKSFQDIALPVLTKHGFPAVLGVTTAWLDGRSTPDNYRGRLLDATALKVVSQSPLVEILSHTDSLHDAVRADAFGTVAAGSITRRFLGHGRYESETDYRARVRADLQRSQQRLREITGRAPAAVVWPYGDFNPILVAEAARLGMGMHLSLDDAMASTQEFPLIRRRLLEKVKTLGDFEEALHAPTRPTAIRLVEIRLDDLGGRPMQEVKREIASQVERVRLLRANTVIVSPYTRDGHAAFFANGGLPARGDFLFRVLHQLRNAAVVQTIILRLPDAAIPPASLQELARRHPFEAVLLTGSRAVDRAPDMLKIIRTYRSVMRCGIAGQAASGACHDFRVVPVNTGNAKAAIQQAQGPNDVPVYLMVNSDQTTNAREWARTLRQIRLEKIRHFGIEDGPALRDPDGFRAIALELAQERGGRGR